jgi:hypothetical protein
MPPAGRHAGRPTRPRPSAGPFPSHAHAPIAAHAPMHAHAPGPAPSAVRRPDLVVRYQWQASDSGHALVVFSGARCCHWHGGGTACRRRARRTAANVKDRPPFTAPAHHAAWPHLPVPRGW